MSVQSSLARPRLREGHVQSIQGISVQPRQRSILIRLVMTIVAYITAVILGVVGIARMGSAPPIFKPPQALLPGSPVPASVPCGAPPEGGFPCAIESYILDLDGKAIYLTFNPSFRMITVTRIAAREYSIGDLLAAWGTPTGFGKDGHHVYVYWGRRYAYLSSCSVQPNSQVEFVGYSLEPIQASRWRGLNGGTRDKC